MNQDPKKNTFSELQSFARKHMNELLVALSVFVASLSAWAELFFGTVGLSFFFLSIAVAGGIFFPTHIDQLLKNIHQLSNRYASTKEIIVEAVRFALALFLPFIYFAFLGLMLGVSYHYYSKKDVM